jgi:hypothetical protein
VDTEMNKEDIVEFLKNNLTINIERWTGHYQYPTLEVKLMICDELISAAECTIYDGEFNE